MVRPSKSMCSVVVVVVTVYLVSCVVVTTHQQQRAFSVDAFVQPTSLRRLSSQQLHSTTADATTDVNDKAMVTDQSATGEESTFFKNIMAANRAEIAVRIMRAATEMNAGTVGIYVHEDRYSQHRWGADRSYLLEKADDATPISAYLDIPQIIQIAKDADVDAIHPGMNSKYMR
jgi:Biotin carboxylase, N-terminal domain